MYYNLNSKIITLQIIFFSLFLSIKIYVESRDTSS